MLFFFLALYLMWNELEIGLAKHLRHYKVFKKNKNDQKKDILRVDFSNQQIFDYLFEMT